MNTLNNVTKTKSSSHRATPTEKQHGARLGQDVKVIRVSEVAKVRVETIGTVPGWTLEQRMSALDTDSKKRRFYIITTLLLLWGLIVTPLAAALMSPTHGAIINRYVRSQMSLVWVYWRHITPVDAVCQCAVTAVMPYVLPIRLCALVWTIAYAISLYTFCSCCLVHLKKTSESVFFLT